MIHAYDKYYLDIAQRKLGMLFELATLYEGLDIDAFAQLFLSSKVSQAIEKADPVYLSGKSAIELLSLVLLKDISPIETNMQCSPEYWVGWALAYIQWDTNKSFAEIIKAYPCSKLLLNYFPYHEMDVTQIADLVKKHLNMDCPLKIWRTKRHLSQSQLALLSGVPIRNIKAYEQGTVELSKAQGETLYLLSKALACTIEDLL